MEKDVPHRLDRECIAALKTKAIRAEKSVLQKVHSARDEFIGPRFFQSALSQAVSVGQ